MKTDMTWISWQMTSLLLCKQYEHWAHITTNIFLTVHGHPFVVVLWTPNPSNQVKLAKSKAKICKTNRKGNSRLHSYLSENKLVKKLTHITSHLTSFIIFLSIHLNFQTKKLRWWSSNWYRYVCTVYQFICLP